MLGFQYVQYRLWFLEGQGLRVVAEKPRQKVERPIVRDSWFMCRIAGMKGERGGERE